MIEEIHRKLIVRYTTVIAAILLFCFGGSYVAYRHSGLKLMEDSLRDYLSEEVWEAGQFARKPGAGPEMHKVASDINSLHNFTYWFVDGILVRAEEPSNDFIAGELRRRLTEKSYVAEKIYHENVKHDKKKWYFSVLKRDVTFASGAKGRVFVLANYTPVRKNTKAYIQIALSAVSALVALSYLVGRLLAARSIKYIEIMYQKQKQFVSDAAHELRTPLSILLSYTELLEYKPRKKEIIGDIKKQILQLNDLIDSLLAIARYDNEKVVLSKEKFDAGRLASDCAQSISHLCSGKSIEVSAQKAELYADQGMVRQLMYILLDNALKYTPDEKKIAITVATDGKRVKISVTDNGIGINARDLPHIFERFWRADQARNAKGLGLGLCLAKMIVELHGGLIDVKSAVGAGSTFEVFLPR